MDSVAVTILEGNLDVPSTVEPGSTSFAVTNNGNEAHGFAISGAAAERLPGDVGPGNTETLEVDLEPGTYTAYCPIEGHEEAAAFTVEQ